MNWAKRLLVKILYHFGYEIRITRVGRQFGESPAKYGCSARENRRAGTIEITKLAERKKIIISSAHAIYDATIWESFDHYFVAVLPEKRGGYLVVDYSKGKVQRMAPDGLELELTSFAEKLSSLKESYFHKHKPGPGEIVFDCGAYCGDSAYLFSQAVGPTGRVFAFEPDSDSYGALVRNIDRHQLKNTSAIHKGVWCKTSIIKLVADGNLGAVVTDVGVRAPDAPTTEIEVVSIPDACREFGLDRLDFLKIDVEGAEIEVVEGALEFLKNHDVHVVVESHRRDGKQTSERVEQMLREIGYEVETRNFVTQDGDSAGIFTWAWRVPSNGSAKQA